MLEGLNPNEIILIGTDLTAIGEVVSVIVAQKALNEDEEDPCEIANLSVLGNILILIGDIIILKGVLIQNQENFENQDDAEEINPIEEEAQRLDTLSSWLDVISDVIQLKGSLLELELAKNQENNCS